MKNVPNLSLGLKKVNALLPMEVYRELYDTVLQTHPKTIIEIGTAHGAAAIAMAIGAKDTGTLTRIFAVDVFEETESTPSSRGSFGTVERNLEIIHANLQRAGVENYVEVLPQSSSDFANSRLAPSRVDILVLDADGRIDRDLLLFGNSLVDGAIVILDDVDGHPRISRTTSGDVYDLKHVISKRVMDEMIRLGYLNLEKLVRNTAFCRAVNPSKWNHALIASTALEAYRTVVFTDLSVARGNFRTKAVRALKRSKGLVKFARWVKGHGLFRN